jgi:hypothetical protein
MNKVTLIDVAPMRGKCPWDCPRDLTIRRGWWLDLGSSWRKGSLKGSLLGVLFLIAICHYWNSFIEASGNDDLP